MLLCTLDVANDGLLVLSGPHCRCCWQWDLQRPRVMGPRVLSGEDCHFGAICLDPFGCVTVGTQNFAIVCVPVIRLAVFATAPDRSRRPAPPLARCGLPWRCSWRCCRPWTPRPAATGRARGRAMAAPPPRTALPRPTTPGGRPTGPRTRLRRGSPGAAPAGGGAVRLVALAMHIVSASISLRSTPRDTTLSTFAVSLGVAL